MAANEARDSVVALSGGPVGGVLMGFGRALPFATTAAAHLLAIAAALMIRTDLRPGGRADGAPIPRPGRQRLIREFTAEAASGIGWLFHRPELRGIVILATIINLGFNSAITAVVFGLQQRGESPEVIGVVSAGIGGGDAAGILRGSPAGQAGGRRRQGSGHRNAGAGPASQELLLAAVAHNHCHFTG